MSAQDILSLAYGVTIYDSFRYQLGIFLHPIGTRVAKNSGMVLRLPSGRSPCLLLCWTKWTTRQTLPTLARKIRKHILPLVPCWLSLTPCFIRHSLTTGVTTIQLWIRQRVILHSILGYSLVLLSASSSAKPCPGSQDYTCNRKARS